MQNVLLDKMSGEYLKSRKTVNGKVVAFELTEDAPLELRDKIEQALGWGMPTQDDYLLDLDFRLSMIELGL